MSFSLRTILKTGLKPLPKHHSTILFKQTCKYHAARVHNLFKSPQTVCIHLRRNQHGAIHETTLDIHSGTVPGNSGAQHFSDATTFSNSVESTLEPTTLTSLSSTLEPISSSLEPTLSSLGLGGWLPTGLVQQSLEFLHVQLDVPWWSAIVIGTICIRIAIFPLVILSQRNSANLNNIMPTITLFQERITTARSTGNVKEMISSSDEMMTYMKANNVDLFKNLIVPLAQLPIFVSVFTGLRQMTTLPVSSMKDGGLWWFCDLTIPDPIWVMPALTAITLLITIEVGVDGIKASQAGSNSLKWFLRCMPFVSLPVMINFPAAMLCYWFTSNTFSLGQVLFLKIPQVRSYFQIPVLHDHSAAYPLKKASNQPQQSFMQSLRQSMKNLELAHEMEERKKHNSLKMREASKENSKEEKIKN